MIYLASSSPRRQELLRQIGLEFQVIVSNIDEVRQPHEQPDVYVRRVASEKAAAVALQVEKHGLESHPVLGADTEVVIDGEVLGKPRDRRHARQMLARLQGRRHSVLSAICLYTPEGSESAVSESRVTLGELTASQIDNYVASGEADDKAGGYAIQGRAAIFVQCLEGSYSGVMGLPLFELNRVLLRVGISA